MKIKFTTNLDNYQKACFPEVLTIPPRIGDSVLVRKVWYRYFLDKKLPTQLEVVNVIWTEDYSEEIVICELWYKNIDVEFAKLNKINLF